LALFQVKIAELYEFVSMILVRFEVLDEKGLVKF
jgi:hypothetical protein